MSVGFPQNPPAPTTSMYYRDPDGNRAEEQIDNFATAEEGQAWMHAPAFDRYPSRRSEEGHDG